MASRTPVARSKHWAPGRFVSRQRWGALHCFMQLVLQHITFIINWAKQVARNWTQCNVYLATDKTVASQVACCHGCRKQNSILLSAMFFASYNATIFPLRGMFTYPSIFVQNPSQRRCEANAIKLAWNIGLRCNRLTYLVEWKKQEISNLSFIAHALQEVWGQQKDLLTLASGWLVFT